MFLRYMAPQVSKPAATSKTRLISNTAPVSAVSLSNSPVASATVASHQTIIAAVTTGTFEVSTPRVLTAKPLQLASTQAFKESKYSSLVSAAQPLPPRSASVLVRAMSTEKPQKYFDEYSNNKNDSSHSSYMQADNLFSKPGLGILCLLGTGFVIHTLMTENEKDRRKKDEHKKDKLKKDEQAKTEEKYAEVSAKLDALAGQKYVKEFDEEIINILVDSLEKLNPHCRTEDLSPEDILNAVAAFPFVIRLVTELYGAEEDKVAFNPELSAKLRAYFNKTANSTQAKVMKKTYTNASDDYIHFMHFLLVNQAILTHYSALMGKALNDDGYDFLSQYRLSEEITFLVKNQKNTTSPMDSEVRSSPRVGSR